MTLKDAEAGKEYIIDMIDTDDEELNAFLFSLGCYSGEPITVVSHLSNSCRPSACRGYRSSLKHCLDKK